jgi:protease III
MTITERSINIFSDEAKLAALGSATLDGLKQYYQALKGANFIDVFAFGNYSTEDVGALTATARELLDKDNTASHYRYQSDFKVGPQQALTLTQDISQSDVGLLDFYIYPEKNDSIVAQFRVINSLFANALLTELRTNQQLGYVANSSVQSVHDYPAFVIMLESDNTDLKTLKLKAMSFIREFEAAFAGVGAEVIDKAKQAAINELTKTPENLFVEAMPFLQDWSQGRLNFDTVGKQVAYIEQTTHQQLQDLYRQFFLNAHYTNASVQLRGKDFAETAYFQWETGE